MAEFRVGDIAPNPFRNIERYPIDREKVKRLQESIGRTEFWDNLVARVGPDGRPQIAYGHHRLVALRGDPEQGIEGLYRGDHLVNLIVRDLDDAAMLHIMADENMQEWSASGAVVVETVRAVRDFLKPSGPAPKVGQATSNGTTEITAFLGWPLGRVRDALSIILSEERGDLKPEDTEGLGIEQASVMRQTVVKIKDPKVRAKAIKEVRKGLAAGDIGKRDIPNVVAKVRVENGLPADPNKVKMPYQVALELHREIEGFWRRAINVNGRMLNRVEAIRLIAENRDAVELRSPGLDPLADQIARALLDMAKQAERLASELSAERLVAAAR